MSAEYCVDEIYLMNESHAFYTATNTFSNPIFDSFNVQESPRNGDNQNKERNGQHKGDPSPTSSKQLLISQTKERWADFCDNFAFSTRNKLFVMETNFKRRLRALRRFLDKKLPPWLLPTTNNQTGSRNGPDERQGPPTLAQQGFVDGIGHLGQLLREERNHFQRQPKQNGHNRWGLPLSNLSEPISAKALGAQQERILSRLERIKRDNQKLSSSSSLVQFRGAWQTSGKCVASRRDEVTEHDDDDEEEDEDDRATDDESRGWRGGGGVSRRVGSRMPKSASSPSQVTVPFWLTRSAKDEPSSSSTSVGPSEATTEAASSTASACSHGGTMAEITSTTKATRPKSASTTTSRVCSSHWLVCQCV